MKTKNFKQSVTFSATPHEVYEAFMDSKKHTAFTGDIAKMSKRVGGAFSAYGGYITGKNLELKPDKKIVQAWRASDWEEGHVSQITFLFTKTKTGTKLEFHHHNIPADDYENIKTGWTEYYWKPMRAMLA